MQKKEMLDGKTTIALVIIIFLLGFGGTMLYYAFYKVSYMRIFDMNLEIVEGGTRVGINADPDLHFGFVPQAGGIARKEMNLGNDLSYPVKVVITLKGPVAKFVAVEDNNFMLQPNKTRKLSVYATVPENFGTTGNFTGEAKVVYFRQ